MSEIVNDANLDEVLKTDKLVVLDFWAQWCGPCRNVGPIIDELHTEYKETVFVGKVNVDENPEASTKYGIRSIPAIYFIKNGVIVDKLVGAAPKTEFVKKIEANK